MDSRSVKVVGVVAALLTIGLAGTQVLTGDPARWGWLVVVCLAGLALLLLALLVLSEVWHHRELALQRAETQAQERRARFATAMSEVHLAHHKLRDAAYVLGAGGDDEAFSAELLAALDRMASAFRIITGRHVRVCVKDLVIPQTVGMPPDVRQLYVVTFARSGNDPEPAVVRERLPGHEFDWVVENTDFEQIWVEGAACFFSNDLLVSPPGYKNSHWTAAVRESGTFDYRSTIVWPIRKVRQGVRDGRVVRLDDLVGFLCVDSPDSAAFDRSTDFHLGASFADALYTVLRIWRPEPAADDAQLVNSGGED